MLSDKPYLIRAVYDWIIDSEVTPYITVAADMPHVIVPREHVENGEIVLNISPEAVSDLEIGNQFITFEARFSGKPFNIQTPVGAVIACYAAENGRGMSFDLEEMEEDEAELSATESINKNKKSSKHPHLTLVE